jgi:hypothetical protein
MMTPTRTRWVARLVTALLFAGAVAGCARPREYVLPRNAPQPPPPDLTPAGPLASGRPALPADAVALVALTDGAETRFEAITPAGETDVLIEPSVVAGDSISLRDGRLAFLALRGLDPAQNSIQVHDLAGDQGWEVRPEAGHIILGFTLGPGGTAVAYLEADARVAGSAVPWWVVTADLNTGRKQIRLGEVSDVALLPIAWTDEWLLYHGITPFGKQAHGLWRAPLSGERPQPVLSEADFVGRPQVSPAGDRLAFLGADAGFLPASYGGGEPPANAVRVLDVAQGRQHDLAAPAAGRDWAALTWLPSGAVAALGGDWDAASNHFVHRGVYSLGASGEPAPDQVLGAAGGELIALAACPSGAWLAAARNSAGIELLQAGRAAPLAQLPAAGLDWMACTQTAGTGS